MAKGSVRKKGKKWYYRFYVEDASGNLVQKECVGTESKSETEKLLRQAMDDYEKKKFVAKAENLTVGQLLDVWAEEELKTGTLSNGTVENYLGTIRNIKKHPLAERKLKNVTSEHLLFNMSVCLLSIITETNGEFGKDLYLTSQKNSINDEEVISNNKLHQNGRVVYKWAIQTLSYDL